MSRRAAIIGGGVIGGGWAARFLLNGWDVQVFDPAAEARAPLEAVLARARQALPALYDRALPPEGRLHVADTLEAAVAGADWVQESVPERLDLKHRVHGAIAAAAPARAVLASSTSGFKPSDFTTGGGRLIVAHPFNPVYLLPLVELVGDPAETARAAAHLEEIGMLPLTLRAEIDAHIADRLLEAVWRESLWLVKDGIATTAEIDDAIRMGFGLRWAQMGLFETYRIAGGAAGMRHFLAQFGPALAWPWSRLTDVPELDADLTDRIAAQSDLQSGALPIAALEDRRDANLVAILRALKARDDAAGGVIAAHEARLPQPEAQDGLPVTADRIVPPTWSDPNGHMTEARYLEAASAASDRFLALIGADAAYIAGGAGYFTLETHLRHLGELHAGDRLVITTQVIGGDGRKVHLFHRLTDAAGRLAASVETLLIHTDLATRRSAPPPAEIAARFATVRDAHKDRARPEDTGRRVGDRPG